jgi:hypothetical protein
MVFYLPDDSIFWKKSRDHRITNRATRSRKDKNVKGEGTVA